MKILSFFVSLHKNLTAQSKEDENNLYIYSIDNSRGGGPGLDTKG